MNGNLRELRAGDVDKGSRLDHFLARSLPELSRSRLQTLIAQGRVTRDNSTIGDPNHRVKPGEAYRIDVPEPSPAEPKPQDIPLVVLYEDGDLIVIDKPSGLVVHPAAGNLDGTLVNALLAHCGPTLKGIGGVARPGIVHRLDKDTSGVLVAAKNERAMRSLAKQFAAHAVERVYNAAVWGAPRSKGGFARDQNAALWAGTNDGGGFIEGNVGRNPFDRKRMAVLRGGGKPARTNYLVVDRFGLDEKAFAALLECRLETGRTHQIRVHLAHIGHPLIGDATYGRSRQPPRPRSLAEKTAFETATDFPRQALHAGVLGFFHPTLQRKMRFESPWPADFSNLVKVLRELKPDPSRS